MTGRSSPQSQMTSRFRVVTGSGSGQRRFNWLVVSVAVNLVLAGLIVAWIVTMPGPHRPLVTWQQDVLPSLHQADAAIASAAVLRIMAQQEEAEAKVGDQYARVRALLAVDPLDQAALEQAMTEIATTRNNEQIAMRRIFFEELTALSADGRAKMLVAMEKESRRWRHHTNH